MNRKFFAVSVVVIVVVAVAIVALLSLSSVGGSAGVGYAKAVIVRDDSQPTPLPTDTGPQTEVMPSDLLVPGEFRIVADANGFVASDGLEIPDPAVIDPTAVEIIGGVNIRVPEGTVPAACLSNDKLSQAGYTVFVCLPLNINE